jgi:hypothetical protein
VESLTGFGAVGVHVPLNTSSCNSCNNHTYLIVSILTLAIFRSEQDVSKLAK